MALDLLDRCVSGTTSETETGFFLIEVFRKLINPQIEGHLDHLQVAFPIYQT